jgi:ADP-heptose:LPS heptosyltransferase
MRNESHQQTLEKILHNNRMTDDANIKQVLILHEEDFDIIGDWVIRFDKLKYLKGYLKNAAITLNFTAEGTSKLSDALLKNNPHLHAITAMKWQEIDFEKYDFILTVSYDEQAILAYLDERYGTSIKSDQFRICVYTMSFFMLKPKEGVTYLFPLNRELGIYSEKMRTPIELFVSREEQEWADAWLLEKGLKDNEQLFIILDSASKRDKLLSIPVYYELLTDLLKRDNVKVLNFDESNMGKEKFYSELLGAHLMRKFIFSKGLSLRQAICLLGSSRTSLVLGPCTGLMHCASGVYNNYVSNGLNKAKAPVLIVYTGRYKQDAGNVYLWWNNNPLMNVLVIRNRNNNKAMLLMDELNEVERVTNDGLSCTEYTAQMLTGFVNQKLPYSYNNYQPVSKSV